MINQEISQNTQMQNQILRGNNKDINTYNISPYKLNQIKNNLYNKLINKNEIRSNFEIPVEFISNKQKQKQNQNMYNMSNFIQKKNIPTLNIDLSSKALSLELKLNELREKEKRIKIRYKEVIEEVKEISKEKKKQKEKLNTKEKERIFISSQIEENKSKINGLYKEQEDLVNKFPPNKLSDKFYKNIPDVQFRKIKFEPPFLDEYFKIKTLNKDLIDYEKYINYLNAKKKPKIDLILQKIKLSVDEALPGYDIKFYGAYGAGINLPWSDINIILFNNNNREKNINNNKDGDNITDIETATGEKSVVSTSEMNNNLASQESSVSDKNNNADTGILNNIFNCLRKYNLFINNELNIIRNESICYLCLITKEEFGNIKIYISIDKPNHPGLKRLELIKSFLKEYPPLRPTILALEKLLKKANLNNQNKGGIPFYGLILMVVSFIQNQKDKYNYSFKEENINGTIFYEFLKYYGIHFDFNKFVIMTYKVNEINTPSNDKENQFILVTNPNIKEFIILDPIDKKTNVAKPAFQYMNIKMAFLIAFMVLQEDCECGCHYGRAYFEHNYISTEHCYLKRIFNSVKRFNPN
jgi:DNA polymerase sigma